MNRNGQSIAKQNTGPAANISGTGTVKRFAVKAMALSMMLAFGSNGYALPVGGVVSAGSAGIASSGGTTTITQTSQNTAINWQSFSIAQTEAVRFVQPNSSSVALNRVLGSDPSSILGSLTANGKVFLLNPNGILFGQGAQVAVGGLVASTLSLSDADFMAGRYNFTGAGSGTVVNKGTINADGGYVALLGANVSNEGVISARLGTVALAAGNAITLDVAGDGLLNVTINEGAVNALVQNGGLIQADGGRVLLTAQAAGNLLQSVVNNTGVIQAHSIQNINGQISLLGDMQSGTVTVAGTLDASGTAPGQTGGTVTITGHHVGLFGATINASGDTGGGTVLVGGGFQGVNATVANASATYMSADSNINADAINSGNGGTAVVWSNDSTRAYGTITARGGALSGNGGQIETSGHWLNVDGIVVNASAPNGTAGSWLLDPADVIIQAGTSNDVLTAGVYEPTSGSGASTIDVAALITALAGGAGTDITITTTNAGAAGVPSNIAPHSGLGDITIASALTWTPAIPGSQTLTLNAAGDVNINATVTTTGGSFVVCCGRDINVNARITSTGVAATANKGGNVLLSAGRNVNIARVGANNAGITTTDGNMEICAGNNINLTSDVAAALLTLTTSVAASAPPTGPTMPRGMTLIAGTNGTGPGAAGGTLNFGAGTSATVTGPGVVSPINIYYNPTSYTTPTDYTGFFTGTPGTITEYMLVFPDGASKAFDGTTTATFSGLKGAPAGVTLNAGGTGTFASSAVGANQTVTFTGLTITQTAPVTAGGAAINFALPFTCCSPIVGKTLASITAATTTPASIAAIAAAIASMPQLVTLAPTEQYAFSVVESPLQSMRLVETQPPILGAVGEAIEVPPPVVEVPPVFVPPVRERKPDRN